MASSHQFARVHARERFVVREEIIQPGEIGFRLFVVTPMDGIIGPLEQPALAINHELQCRGFRRRTKT